MNELKSARVLMITLEIPRAIKQVRSVWILICVELKLVEKFST